MTTDYKKIRQQVNQFAKRNNLIGLYQFCSTLLFYLLTWCFYLKLCSTSQLWPIPFLFLLILLFNCRFFSLMHDCGHGALFKNRFLNKLIGFTLGVIVGIPCYLWARDHAFHHKTNGDWESYRGPLEVITLKEYRSLTPSQQKKYRFSRSLWIAPFVGLFYLIINPRYLYVFHIFAYIEFAAKKRFSSCAPKRQRPAPTWPRTLTKKEFIHMSLNNLFFVPLLVFLSLKFGCITFLLPFCCCLSLAGTIIFIIFISQHNFEHAYATTKEQVDPLLACLHGTSFVQMPEIWNYFTANIAYHHVHHLSAQIPNYKLRECHKALASQFTDVKRMTITDVFCSLKYNLWDTDNDCLTTTQHVSEIKQAPLITEK